MLSSMKKYLHLPLCLLLAFTLSLAAGCGFQLRGAQMTGFTSSSIYLNNQGASQLLEQVRLQLQGAGATIAESPQEADYVLGLTQERFERSVLSVSAVTGKVEEYLITYSAGMDVRKPGGEQLVGNERITLSRDYTFDEGAVLGKSSEESVIRDDLVFRTSSQVLRRLQAVTSNSN